jgi:dTDP-4-dehydrorhamnose 3,5-epimerase
MTFHDNRGYLQTIYSKKAYANYREFVWEYVTKSYYGVLRGLHYQVEPKAQGKLIVCLEGRIYDVIVNLKTGEWHGGFLEPGNQVYAHIGYAHGFQVISDTALVLYKCTEEYSPEYERGILWSDPGLRIEWPAPQNPILSERDTKWPLWTPPQEQ